MPQPDPPFALAQIVQQCCLQEHSITTTPVFQNPQNSQAVLLERSILAKEKLNLGRGKVPLQYTHIDRLGGSHQRGGELLNAVGNPQHYHRAPKTMRPATQIIGLMAMLKIENGSIQSAIIRSIKA